MFGDHYQVRQPTLSAWDFNYFWKMGEENWRDIAARGERQKREAQARIAARKAKLSAPKMAIVQEKGVPTSPVAPSAGFSKEVARLYQRPMSENARIVPALKAKLTELSPPYLFELSRRTFVTDKDEAVAIFWLAKLRAGYDTSRCTDTTVGGGVVMWNQTVADVIRYIQAHPSISKQGMKKALEREKAFPTDTSPAWICFHGIQAVSAAFAGKQLENWHKPRAQ